MTDKDKIVLARFIVEHATKDKKYSLPAAKLCAIIMEVMYIQLFSFWLLSTGYNDCFGLHLCTAERKKWSILRLILEYMSDAVREERVVFSSW